MMNTIGEPAEAASFRRALLAHYDGGRRALPWRAGRTPYRVMVSEFMLQQTRAETVVPYYERWLRRFPDWESLAGATEDEVLREWKGLGYYSRARNLHRTARAVRERHGGQLPPDPATLRALPGVGDYTAGAVASIAFGVAVPAVDGNTRRVLARLLDIAAPSPAQLRREAARLLDPTRPGDFNEAMMELGATLCTPRAPRCGECPVARWCRARAAGTVEERPAPRTRRPVPRVEYATAVLVDAAGRTLLVRRPPQGLLANMWEFPAVRLGAGGAGGAAARPAGEAIVAAARGVASERASAHAPEDPLPPVRHAFTHLRATYHPIILPGGPKTLPGGPKTLPGGPQTPSGGPQTPSGGPQTLPGTGSPPAAWVHHTRLGEWALPVAQQKIGTLLQEWIARRPGSVGAGPDRRQAVARV